MRNLITCLLAGLILASSASAGSFSHSADLYGPANQEVGYGTKTTENFLVKIDEGLPLFRSAVPSGAAIGDLIRIDGDTSAALSRADSEATARVDGYIYEMISSVEARIRTAGRIPGLSGLNPGSIYYLSASDSGKVTDVAPANPNYSVRIGVALDATTLVINTSPDVANTGGDLQDAYDKGSSSPNVDLEPAATITFRDSGANPLLKIDSATGGIQSNSIRPTSGAQAIKLDPDGDVGIGTGTPAARLDVRQRVAGEPAVDVIGAPSATADLQRWLVDGVGTPRARVDAAGNLYLNDASLVNVATSVPAIQVSTPIGALWMTDFAPPSPYEPLILHVWNGSDWSPIGVTGGGQATYFQTDSFSPTSGQTIFSLSTTPATTNNLIFAVVDGGVYYEDVSFTITGSTLTWLDTPFPLGPPDDLVVYYQVGAAPSPTQMVQEVFTATAGQTGFLLSDTPAGLGWFFVFVNGIEYDETTHWIRSGPIVTWLDNPSSLPAGARVTVNYQR